MATLAPPPLPAGYSRIYAWRRVRVMLIVVAVLFFLFVWGWEGWAVTLLLRLVLLGLVQLGVFGLLERWPKRLPSGLARWALQLVGVALVVPFAMAIIYAFTTFGDAQPWYHDKD